LLAADVVVGSLNMYSQQSHAFDEDTPGQVRMLVDYAAEIIAESPIYAMAEDVVDEAVAALEDRAIVARAVGVLMHLHGRTPSDAFDLLEDRAAMHRETTRAAAERVLEEVQQQSDQGGDDSP
jgi:AmiR/NasT family two-component response regulator